MTRETAEVGCEACDFTGFLIREEAGREYVSPCSCQRRERGAQDLVSAGVPRRYLHCTLENYNPRGFALQKQALGFAREFVQSWPACDRGLLFMGSVGTGKTHLATAILRELILEHGVEGCFADYQDLLKRIQATFSRSGGPGEGVSEDDILSPVLAAEVLVLDDLGSRRSTAWAEETLAHVLTVRYNEERITIITTNLLDAPRLPDAQGGEPFVGDGGALADRINERTLSRIHEMCRVILVEGDDFRRRGRT